MAITLQTIIIYFLVAGAALYVGKKIYKSFTEKACAKGCSCNCNKGIPNKIEVKE